MKSKTRVEKLERQIGNDQRFQIIEWDRSRLTKDEVDFIGTRGGVDEQTFMVAEGTKEHELAKSILSKHDDLIIKGHVRLIVLVSVAPDQPNTADQQTP